MQERQTESRIRQRRTSVNLPTEQVLQEDIPLLQSSYERADSLQNTHVTHTSSSNAMRTLPALVISTQGCLAIGIILTHLSAASGSLQHQWLGYVALMLLLALIALLGVRQYSRIKSSTIQMESGAIPAERDVSHRILRITAIMLLLCLSFAIISGWMCTLDFFWGLIWIEDVHSVLAYAASALLVIFGALALFLKLRNDSF